MGLHIDEHLTVYRDPRFYCGPGPSVVVGPQGHLLVGFRRVHSWLDDGHVGHWHPGTESCLTHSEDGGQTWSPPRIFLAGCQCPCLTRLTDGTLIHSTHRMELVTQEIAHRCGDHAGVRQEPWPGVHAGTAIWRSEDGGASWQDAVYLDGVPGMEPLHANLSQPVAVRGNVLETASGRLVVSAYGLNVPGCAYLFESRDQGRSWTYQALVAEDYNETFLYETESGALIAFMRRQSDAEYLHRARSEDGGNTWSSPQRVCRGYPACATRLPSGRVMLAYGFRFEEGFGVRAQILSPECETLPGEPECILQADGAVRDLGYPDVDLLPDGRALVVYYTNSLEDADDATAPRYIVASVLRED